MSYTALARFGDFSDYSRAQARWLGKVLGDGYRGGFTGFPKGEKTRSTIKLGDSGFGRW